MNLPQNAIDLFGTDLYFAAVTFDASLISDIEDVSVGVHVHIVPVGDIDEDGTVGTTDFLALLGAWGSCVDCSNCPADLDGNCSVGITDFLILLGNWG